MINARKCSKLIHIYVYRQSCFVHSSVNFSNWNMTFKETVATTWKMNEIQFRQLFLNPWHMLSSIWVLLGLWLVIYTVKIQFSFIFPASAWSPFLSVNLTDKLARLRTCQFNAPMKISEIKHENVRCCLLPWRPWSIGLLASRWLLTV